MASRLINKNNVGWLIAMTIFYLVASFMFFYGIKLLFPVLANGGRSSLTLLPAVLTCVVPIVIFYIFWLFWRSKTLANRLRLEYIAGLVLIFVSGFNIVDLLLVLSILLKGNILFGIVTPCYPLDMLIANGIYLMLGITIMVYHYLDRKYVLTSKVMPFPLKTKYMVFAGFLLPFAAYFAGDFLSMYIYFINGIRDPNWPLIIPYYISFLLPSFLGLVYIYQSRFHEEKTFLRNIIVLLSISAFALLWIIIGLIINPYVISESLQYEFAIGLVLKYPIGLLIIYLWVLIPSLISIIRIIRKNKRKKDEQEQAKI